ncbi:MAG: ribonuclease R [Proteobacteria bacterium]|nr:ribonuclease R [Pseudomonadota bacterium]
MKDNLLDIIKKRFNRPFHYKELVKVLKIKGKDKINLLNSLIKLVNRNELVKLKGDYFAVKGSVKEILCRVSCHRDGYGFAIPIEERSEDLFLPPHQLVDIYDGDIVWVRKKERKGKKSEGEIIRIESRGVTKIVGRVERYKNLLIVRPTDKRFFWPLIIKNKENRSFSIGDYVVSKIIKYPIKGWGEAIIEEVISGDSYEIEIKNLLVKLNISEKYPEIAEKEALIIAKKGTKKDSLERKDLRKLNFVTIDGERAKDFDDAVYLKKEKNGYRLYVAIADVSNYVKKGTELDKEALYRGNSYYFPDRAVPMLPHILSDNLCSLKPLEDKLTFVVEIFYDNYGIRKFYDFYLAIIKSKHRLTYEIVDEVLKGNINVDNKTDDMLFKMRELTGILCGEREERGSIDFDLPEPEIIIGLNGKIEDIVKSKRLFSHRLIEEFMISANRAVAEWFIDRKIPSIFRVHEPPSAEKINNLAVFLKHLGYSLPQKAVSTKIFREILDNFKNSPYERLVNTIVLRSMMQAKYSPEPLGHFGLAIDAYLHFTSPIRRYSDLVVHRDLKNFHLLGKKPKNEEARFEELLKICNEINKREREAFDAEREIYDFSAVTFMKDYEGDDFKGIISNITKNGIYVELIDYFIEGFVPLEEMLDDYYIFEEEKLRMIGRRRKKIYTLGKEVVVKLVKADIFTKKIYFVLI